MAIRTSSPLLFSIHSFLTRPLLIAAGILPFTLTACGHAPPFPKTATPPAMLPPAQGEVSGSSPGSGRRMEGAIENHLPSGRNWRLVIDDEFDEPTLNTNIREDWYRPGTIRSANGGTYQMSEILFSPSKAQVIRPIPWKLTISDITPMRDRPLKAVRVRTGDSGNHPYLSPGSSFSLRARVT
jgi:hypothetical protein